MQLPLRVQQIKDKPRLLLSLAEAIEVAHNTKSKHGKIHVNLVEVWLDGSDIFIADRFYDSCIGDWPKDEDTCRSDSHDYVKLSIQLITGRLVCEFGSFRAAEYLNTGWSEEFLKQIEGLNTIEACESVSMSSFIAALKSSPIPPNSNENLEQSVNDSTPISIPSKTPSPPRPADAQNFPPRNIPSTPPLVPKPLSQLKDLPPRIEQVRPKISIQLRNGTVGRPYEVEAGAIAKAIAKQRGENTETACVSHLQLPENCGLTFNETTGALTGVPSRPFEEELGLDYLPSRSARSIPFTVKLLINPDPASLWKDLQFPANSPYQKESTAHSEHECGPFRIVAASRRGRSHANKGEFRDDDYAIGFASTTCWLVVAVADGAGSAAYSRRGSQIACAAAKNQLVGTLDSAIHNKAEALFAQHGSWEHPEVKTALRQILYEAALLAHDKLKQEVAEPSEPLPAPPILRNYDTTLILLVMKKVHAGWVVATFAIGDGGAGLLSDPANGHPLTRPDSGEHAGQTTFLTFPSTLRHDEDNLGKRFQMALSPQLTVALAMTDGITDPKFPSDAAYTDPAQWKSLWNELQSALASSNALLDWMNFFSPGNHDDRTLVAILPAASTSANQP